VPQGAVPEVDYESAPTGTPAQVLIGGEYFTPSTPVFFGGTPATSIHVLSDGFLVAGVPAGADASDVTVGPFVPQPTVTSPAPGTVGATSTPAIQGNGVAGDTVKLTYSEGTACSATVAASGSWSCTPGSPLPTGLVSLTATQQNPAGVPSHTSTDLFYVGTPPATLRVNDTDPGFIYQGGFTYSSDRGLGDLNDDIHYATTNGASVTYTFIGTGVKVFGEQYVDQGDIGVSIDGGAQTTVNTVPADGQRHSDVAVFTSPTLAPGLHTITVTKLSGQYFTFDGVEVDYAG
jgi:Bacterial Ig-like domain